MLHTGYLVKILTSGKSIECPEDARSSPSESLCTLRNRYFEFHPAPKTRHTSPKTHGVIPVWGFGTVVESQVAQIQVGERVLCVLPFPIRFSATYGASFRSGYFPSAKYMLIKVNPEDGLNAFNFYAHRPELPADRRPYHQITRCASDPLYSEEREDAAMLYRPLFWTSFWAEDWLNSSDYRDARRIVISSASSKTGFCLALCIRRRIEKTKKDLKIVGLTSAANKKFVEGLGLYDEVLLYGDYAKLDVKQGPYCYVDVAGNDSLNEKIIKHLGDSMSFGVVLGMSHVSETKSSIKETAEKEKKLEMFFMPEWLHIVRQTTPVKEIAELQKEGWEWIMKDGDKWVNLETVAGKNPVLDRFKQTLKGSIPPNRGLIFTLWEGTESVPKAKL